MASSRPFSRLEVFDVLAPAGTAKAAPLETQTPWLPGELVGVTILIPDGHNGLTGIQLALAHAPVIPRTPGAWLTGNDEKVELDSIGQLNTGAWSALVYNGDVYDHTFHVRYEVADFAFLEQTTQVPPLATPLVS